MLLLYFWLVLGPVFFKKKQVSLNCMISLFFFATLWKISALSAEVSILLSNYCTCFQKNDTNGKIGCFSNGRYRSLFILPHVLRSSKVSVGGFFDLIVFNFLKY